MTARSRIKSILQSVLGFAGLLATAEHLARSARAILTPTGRAVIDRYQRMNALYAQFIRPRDLVFDIGANMGTRVETALAIGARHVVAADPQTRCIRYLRLKYGRNRKVSIVPKGLASEPGTMKLYIGNSTGIGTFLPAIREIHTQMGRRFSSEETAELTTLDALIAQFGVPDFVKIDTEGYEPEVLKGLSQPLPLLSFEILTYNPGAALECLQRLSELGRYEYNYIAEEGYHLALTTWISRDDLVARINGSLPAEMKFGDIFARISPH